MDQQRPTVKSIRTKLGLTSAHTETDTSGVQLKLQHPVLRTHQGDLLRSLNPSRILVDSLIQKDLITEDKKSELENERFVLGKVKLILLTISECDDDELARFIESLTDSDVHGNNTQLAEVLNQSYTEHKNGVLREFPQPQCRK